MVHIIIALIFLVTSEIAGMQQEVLDDVQQQFEQNPLILHDACGAGDLQTVRQLIVLYEKINISNEGGWTPLHRAALKGYTEIVRILLNGNACVNALGNDHETPLHQSVQWYFTKTPWLLLEHGARVDAQTKAGRTPLHWAAIANNIAALKILLFYPHAIADDWRPSQENLSTTVRSLKNQCLRLILSKKIHGNLHLLPNELKQSMEDTRRILYIQDLLAIKDKDGRTACALAVQCDRKTVACFIKCVMEATEIDHLKVLGYRKSYPTCE